MCAVKVWDSDDPGYPEASPVEDGSAPHQIFTIGRVAEGTESAKAQGQGREGGGMQVEGSATPQDSDVDSETIFPMVPPRHSRTRTHERFIRLL